MTETLDVRQAADFLKIHEQSVLEKIRAGELPAAKVGRAYVLLRRDLLSYIERLVSHQTAKRMTGKPVTRGRSPSPSHAGSHTA